MRRAGRKRRKKKHTPILADSVRRESCGRRSGDDEIGFGWRSRRGRWYVDWIWDWLKRCRRIDRHTLLHPVKSNYVSRVFFFFPWPWPTLSLRWEGKQLGRRKSYI